VSRAPAGTTLGLLVLAVTAWSCATAPVGGFVWVDQYQPAAVDPRGGVIRPGDLVDIRVLGQEQLSARARVRADGRVALPFLSEIQAAGQTPDALRALVEDRLKEYVNSPVVTVAVEEAPPAPISILGEVARPGKYAYEPSMGLVHALALAGGLTEYAHKDRVLVLRGQPTPIRIRFDFRRLLRGEGRGLAFALEPGDIVVAE